VKFTTGRSEKHRSQDTLGLHVRWLLQYLGWPTGDVHISRYQIIPCSTWTTRM